MKWTITCSECKLSRNLQTIALSNEAKCVANNDLLTFQLVERCDASRYPTQSPSYEKSHADLRRDEFVAAAKFKLGLNIALKLEA